uniref:RNA helicase n=1 Tax=Polytomella parva TaxID=51329 RepID=A0A7S0YU80_9CHLO|mmetsp:Transcript_9860/g.18405  ORF Transcript_9860/g.18405 Transcript_9860/m.18405 type:complete len:452 (+) Transcript_9860:57-1412(+)
MSSELTNQLASATVEDDVDAPTVSDPSKVVIETASKDDIYSSAKTFDELGLSEELLKGIYAEMGFSHPSKIQATTLPMILKKPYTDLVAQAHNGSGKTTCFVLSMLSHVDVNLKKTQAICVCPTRELSIQNYTVMMRMGKYTGITILCTATEENIKTAIVQQIIVGTHGRIKNWLEKRVLFLEEVKVIVLDEADNILDASSSGSSSQADDSVRLIQRIKAANRRTPVQVLLFSATFNDTVKKFTERLCPKANRVFVPKEDLSLDAIAQYNVRCPTQESKLDVLRKDIFPNIEALGNIVIFVKRRNTAALLHNQLKGEGYICTSIGGHLTHPERDAVINEFRKGTTKILIATDVLSRGFDVEHITLVINYDLPTDAFGRPAMETYLHRIGRSGRFGRKGIAFNFIVDSKDVEIMNSITQYYQKHIEEINAGETERFEDMLEKYNQSVKPGSS